MFATSFPVAVLVFRFLVLLDMLEKVPEVEQVVPVDPVRKEQ